ncbi:NAD(P)-dependent alcohol dehydrogenase [Agromyces sp. LHK192]|uniref:NAD(P)-dependent alcohol dehydrogenase n=1 Tax=Agromyces sp. LHK192 TaxID=2498704 RepID=UPI00196A6A1A|nr:NAD(P)-dependent alcohol dehydrogenase [Agromyces sp. LHK192]
MTTTETRTTMRAARLERFGPPEVVSVGDALRPEPDARELLVRLRATTVSIADHRLRTREVPRGLGLVAAPKIGLFRPRVRTLGMEGAGVVEAVGAAVTRFAPGDEVMVMRGAAFGCHAEYATVAETGDVARKPAALSFEEAAAVIFGGHTAVRYLDLVDLRPGVEVLVNGASGAVGSAVVQLAAARGATVTAVTSGRNTALVRSLGASRAIDYTREDFTATDAPRPRYDVVVECVGNAPYSRVRHLIRPGGALLLVIADLAGMIGAGIRPRRRGVLVNQSGGPMGPALMQRVAALAESGDLRPVIDRTYELDEIVEAHRYVDTGRKRGSVVVRIP